MIIIVVNKSYCDSWLDIIKLFALYFSVKIFYLWMKKARVNHKKRVALSPLTKYICPVSVLDAFVFFLLLQMPNAIQGDDKPRFVFRG